MKWLGNVREISNDFFVEIHISKEIIQICRIRQSGLILKEFDLGQHYMHASVFNRKIQIKMGVSHISTSSFFLILYNVEEGKEHKNIYPNVGKDIVLQFLWMLITIKIDNQLLLMKSKKIKENSDNESEDSGRRGFKIELITCNGSIIMKQFFSKSLSIILMVNFMVHYCSFFWLVIPHLET